MQTLTPDGGRNKITAVEFSSFFVDSEGKQYFPSLQVIIKQVNLDSGTELLTYAKIDSHELRLLQHSSMQSSNDETLLELTFS